MRSQMTYGEHGIALYGDAQSGGIQRLATQHTVVLVQRSRASRRLYAPGTGLCVELSVSIARA